MTHHYWFSGNRKERKKVGGREGQQGGEKVRRKGVEGRKILKNKLPDYLVIGQSIKNLWATKK